jgi:hypothetical protein
MVKSVFNNKKAAGSDMFLNIKRGTRPPMNMVRKQGTPVQGWE